ncbi:RelA/SpoT family protein [Aureibacter tunicatorum]|uniref:GTP pyrophosphokinase n=1 Tax=Aureibacter tunicatorum TaxID=866807 RepID=A0AAE4BRY4_9BACT|nr:bifunctional (p)ppGpp synthetase/guanosine-3',5'-bis(diphosphate) 3'-pyrophosphohydrolase [Aureibacter tunicatorum]MDR6238330.1 GTP pyrophosphokinase [Aureibacter tunicatorum]BDD03362.1 RelA/SpoT family protein [Aureibacter tunicatorum]
MVEIDTAEENKEIARRYRHLLKQAQPYLQDDDASIIRKAFNVALEAHKDMRRKSGEPYIYHPIEVARICVDEIGLGTTSIVAALLHDVVEDTDITLKEIEELFGPKVAQIIDGLTKISGVFEKGTSQQAENFRKMLLTLSEDLRVILIKLADRLHNMRTLNSMPRNKQLKIASETIYLYAPLAHRLGLYAIKSELEDLWLKYSNYNVYKEIANKINETKRARGTFIKSFIEPIKKELDENNLKYEIKGRPKSIHSIWNKMRAQNVPFEEIYDLFAIRIILDCPFEIEKAICWQVYSIVTDYYKPNPDRLRDWISTSKANGYESLHTTVMSKSGKWVEVQIRTRRMDEIAEKGYAAHWKYKEKTNKSSSLDEWVAKIRDMMTESDATALEFVDEFKSNLYNDEVFVFTPKGDLKILPKDSTALDFAFDIHTEVGAKCIGAKVSQKLVPLNYKLKNGDQVEIITSNKQKPAEGWLGYVVTSKARARIRESLQEEKKIRSEEGREIVLRKLKQMKIEPSSDIWHEIRSFFNEKNQMDFLSKIATGEIDSKELKRFKEKKESLKQKKTGNAPDAKSFEKELKNVKGEEHDVLLIGEDMDVVEYTIAQCCKPIPGDEVFGFVTVSEGIKIHRTNCPNAVELMSNHGHRVIKAGWASKKQTRFVASMLVIGTDRVGLISDITKVISEQMKVNVRSMSISSEDGIFEGKIQLFISDTDHLNDLIKLIRKVPDIIKVHRIEDKD